MMKLTILAVIVLAYPCGTGQAQQATVYGPDGKVRERITTDSQGSKTIYDAAGRVVGRTATDSQGTTTLYDADGRKAGSVTTTRPVSK